MKITTIFGVDSLSCKREPYPELTGMIRRKRNSPMDFIERCLKK
jgi:hypothetical protein